MKLHWDAILFAGIELAIITNIVILDVALLRQNRQSPTTAIGQTQTSPTCDSACQTMIDTAVAKAVSALPIASPTVIQQNSRPASALPTESYVPFGSGTTQNDQWEDLPGVESYIDTAKYPGIHTVYFEVSMSIPTKNGVVSARLYNVTDKHPVWFSEVSTDSDVGKLVTTKIQLDTGNKLYRVQMKTSLRYHSILDFARVKIITKWYEWRSKILYITISECLTWILAVYTWEC